MRGTRLLTAGLLVVLAAAFAGSTACSTTSEDQPTQTSEQPAITGEPAGFDAEDITFAFQVIAHHGQSVELTALAADRSTDQDVVALAASVTAAQSPELELAKALLVQWNQNPNGDGGQSGAVPGMVDGATFVRLQSLTGQEFDTAWLQSMISHGQGAVTIAEAEIANGTNVDAVSTARQMVEAQRGQIGQMQQLLAG